MMDVDNHEIRKISVTLLSLLLIVGLVALQQDKHNSKDQMEFNRNDVSFMNMMIVHHDQAIEMAELSENRTDNEKILELSDNISEAQTRENEQMREWMDRLGYRTGNHHPMAGMASQNEMEKLRNSNSSEYNKFFSGLMIEHHRGGIAMAKKFYRTGEHTELRDMQKGMIETQQNEIQMMQSWQESRS